MTTVWIEGRASTVTEKAVFVKVDTVDGDDFEMPSSKDICFPKSQMTEIDTDDITWGDDIEFAIPEWLADEKDLI